MPTRSASQWPSLESRRWDSNRAHQVAVWTVPERPGMPGSWVGVLSVPSSMGRRVRQWGHAVLGSDRRQARSRRAPACPSRVRARAGDRVHLSARSAGRRLRRAAARGAAAITGGALGGKCGTRGRRARGYRQRRDRPDRGPRPRSKPLKAFNPHTHLGAALLDRPAGPCDLGRGRLGDRGVTLRLAAQSQVNSPGLKGTRWHKHCHESSRPQERQRRPKHGTKAPSV